MDTEKQRLIKTLQVFWKNNLSKLEYVNRSVDLMRKFDDNSMFLRDCFDDGHFVSWVVVVNKEKTKVLLMHHIKLGTWQHFGWHADGEINLRDAAIRELKEEAWISQEEAIISGEILNIDVHFVPTYKWEKEHYHYDINFLAIVDNDVIFTLQEEEVHSIKWFNIQDVLCELDSWKYSSGFCKNIKMI
jgi:8-oxo-dGTP pyrophosphatase MutT (NUDIX family)